MESGLPIATTQHPRRASSPSWFCQSLTLLTIILSVHVVLIVTAGLTIIQDWADHLTHLALFWIFSAGSTWLALFIGLCSARRDGRYVATFRIILRLAMAVQVAVALTLRAGLELLFSPRQPAYGDILVATLVGFLAWAMDVLYDIATAFESTSRGDGVVQTQMGGGESWFSRLSRWIPGRFSNDQEPTSTSALSALSDQPIELNALRKRGDEGNIQHRLFNMVWNLKLPRGGRNNQDALELDSEREEEKHLLGDMDI